MSEEVATLLNTEDYSEKSTKANAESFIVSRINEAITYANDALTALNDNIEGTTRAAESLSNVSVAYDDQTTSIYTPTNFDETTPESADISTSTSFNPTQFDLQLPNIPSDITVPEMDEITDISGNVGFIEEQYYSSTIETLKETLNDSLINGYGIPPEVEQAIYDRDKVRRELEADDAIRTATELIAGRGFSLPVGSLNATINQAVNNKSRILSDLSNDIMINASDTQIKTREYIISSIKEIENMLLDAHNKKQDRVLDVEKSSISNSIQIWINSLERYKNLLEAARIEAEVRKLSIDSVSTYNDSVSKMNEANINLEISKLDAEIKEASLKIDKFKSDVSLYETKLKAYEVKENLSAQSKSIENDVSMKNADGKFKAAEASIQAVIAIKSILLEAQKSSSNNSAQIIASALQSVNSGINYSYRSSYSNDHNHDETKKENPGTTTSVSVDYKLEDQKTPDWISDLDNPNL